MPLLLSHQVDAELEKLRKLEKGVQTYDPNDIRHICNHAIKVFKNCVDEFAKNAISILNTKGPGYLTGVDSFADKIKLGLNKAFDLKSKLLNEKSRGIYYIPRKYIEGVYLINNLVKEIIATFQSGNITGIDNLKEKLKKHLSAYPMDGDNANDPEKIVYQNFYDWLEANSKINKFGCYESLEDVDLILVNTKFFDFKALNSAQVDNFKASVNKFIGTLNGLDANRQEIETIANDLLSLKNSLDDLDKKSQSLISTLQKMLEANCNDVNAQLEGLKNILEPYDFAQFSQYFEYIKEYLTLLLEDKSLDSLSALLNDLMHFADDMADDFNKFNEIKNLFYKIQEEPAAAEEAVEQLRAKDYCAGIDEALDVCQSVLENMPAQVSGMSR